MSDWFAPEHWYQRTLARRSGRFLVFAILLIPGLVAAVVTEFRDAIDWAWNGDDE